MHPSARRISNLSTRAPGVRHLLTGSRRSLHFLAALRADVLPFLPSAAEADRVTLAAELLQSATL